MVSMEAGQDPTPLAPRRVRIVAIDDDPDLLWLLRASLASAVCEVETYADPAIGLGVVLTDPPRLVLTDFNMPGLSGLDVIREIRARYADVRLPVIVLSARGEEDVILQCFGAGATDYLVKPFSPGALKAKVSLLLARAAAAAAALTRDPPDAEGAPAPAREPGAGHVFAGHRIVRRIGEGGMGIVFEAVAPDGRSVALKVLAPEMSRDRTLLRRFFREAENLKAVRHENVAAFHELGHEHLRYYLSMELVDGRSLEAVLQEAGGPLGEDRALGIAAGIARALEALHGLGIIHRDVKPANVLLTRSDAVKLVDFGLTKRSTDEQLTETDMLMGTASYVAPEQIRGGNEPDARSDLYAVGVVLYRMATGRKPFEGSTPLAILFQHADATPTPPAAWNPELSGATSALILRLLEKDPAARPQTAAALSAELEACRGCRPAPS